MRPWTWNRVARGPWTPRYDKPTATGAIAPPPVLGDEPAHSTPRPACTLAVGEQVLVCGIWRTIDRVECVHEPYAPAQTLLHVDGGAILGSRFDHVYESRDVDEQASAKAEACHGVG